MQLSRFRNFLNRLDRDESGDIPVGTLLLIGLVVIPLVIGLIAFGSDISTWLEGLWTEDVLTAKIDPYNSQSGGGSSTP